MNYKKIIYNLSAYLQMQHGLKDSLPGHHVEHILTNDNLRLTENEGLSVFSESKCEFIANVCLDLITSTKFQDKDLFDKIVSIYQTIDPMPWETPEQIKRTKFLVHEYLLPTKNQNRFTDVDGLIVDKKIAEKRTSLNTESITPLNMPEIVIDKDYIAAFKDRKDKTQTHFDFLKDWLKTKTDIILENKDKLVWTEDTGKEKNYGKPTQMDYSVNITDNVIESLIGKNRKTIEPNPKYGHEFVSFMKEINDEITAEEMQEQSKPNQLIMDSMPILHTEPLRGLGKLTTDQLTDFANLVQENGYKNVINLNTKFLKAYLNRIDTNLTFDMFREVWNYVNSDIPVSDDFEWWMQLENNKPSTSYQGDILNNTTNYHTFLLENESKIKETYLQSFDINSVNFQNYSE